jgi:twitching motility protein PilT
MTVFAEQGSAEGDVAGRHAVDGSPNGAAGDVVSAGAEVDRLLTTMVERGGSDLHITVGIEPCIRVDGELHRLTGELQLGPDDTERLIRSVLTDEQWQRFLAENELDFAYAIPRVSRFRVNVYRQRGSIGAAFRGIPHTIRSLAELGVPDAVERFSQLPRGLVLVTGPTGSGKSTTLASLLDVANKTRSGHIVTIEDPIEYLHRHGTCVVNQREVGSDTSDFATALKHVLRQDPDIILVGELRDLETTSVAITAAETGHLVLATLHAPSAVGAIDRMIDAFPENQQRQARSQLAACLRTVVTQYLLPRRDGGRAAAIELVPVTPAVANIIRKGELQTLPTAIQSGREAGMIPLERSLARLVESGAVAPGVIKKVAADHALLSSLAGTLR